LSLMTKTRLRLKMKTGLLKPESQSIPLLRNDDNSANNDTT